MIKITFVGAGSTVFARSVLGDIMLTEGINDAEIALYDIDKTRLEESFELITYINNNINEGRATIKAYHGVENRKEALRGANFIVNAIQVGGYEPSTVIDFEIPKKYGLKQTIADTLGIGGIFRALRTIPVLREIAKDIEEVCPDAWFLNYTNPMAMLTGYMLRYTKVKTIGICHSVQVCAASLFKALGMEKPDGLIEKIAGINHMAWLLELKDKDGNDLYPMIREKVKNYENPERLDMVRLDYVKKFGYYVTESSEHNAEYNPFYIKNKYPELIEKFNIPLDEYPRRCVSQIEKWKNQKQQMFNKENIKTERSREYASYIIEAMVKNVPFKLGANVINNGLIPNLPKEACVEVPCMVDNAGIHPTYVGELPLHLAAMNMSNIMPQMLAIQAAVTKNKEDVYHAAMMDPHTAAELSLDDIITMCDEMIEAHNKTDFKVLY
ncbi:MAG: alpha-glucosidase/alpha-galactosidase [Clostridia bacterium]|nr:alpha-glucosidase/alpha-galactosidase [Clostridia bacterium]